jgi:hypothetical protein
MTQHSGTSVHRAPRRRRHSRVGRWFTTNAPYIFLYTLGILFAIAATYWLVKDAERDRAQGVGLLEEHEAPASGGAG